jgi:hypothetical protein
MSLHQAAIPAVTRMLGVCASYTAPNRDFHQPCCPVWLALPRIHAMLVIADVFSKQVQFLLAGVAVAAAAAAGAAAATAAAAAAAAAAVRRLLLLLLLLLLVLLAQDHACFGQVHTRCVHRRYVGGGSGVKLTCSVRKGVVRACTS